MSEARAAYAPILAAFAEVAALARRTIMAVSPDQHKILSSAIELFVNTPRGTFESVLGAEPNLDAVVRVATRRSHDSKATSITERHWDPDKPGEVTETRWDRPVDDDGDDAGVTAPAAAGGDAAPPVGGGPVEPADYAVLDRILEHLQHVLGNGDDDLPSTVSPILVVLKNIAQENAFVRRYLKPRVAPRERDLSLKPEDGASLRAMLTKHLTSYGTPFPCCLCPVFAWPWWQLLLSRLPPARSPHTCLRSHRSDSRLVTPGRSVGVTHLCALIGRVQTPTLSRRWPSSFTCCATATFTGWSAGPGSATPLGF